MGKRSKQNRKRQKMNADYGRHASSATSWTPGGTSHSTSALPTTNGEPRIRYMSKVYKILEADGFVGYKEDPSEILPERRPMNHWRGAKIPWSVLDQIKAYFEWSQETTGSEVTMRLFHNKTTGEWKAWAFPQERGGGMSAKEIGDHPLYTGQRNDIGLGFECMGSIHHHCKASAFQSSTDLADEENWAGIHFTLGHIGTSKYDVHVRCKVGDTQTPIDLSELFSLDERAMAIIPSGMWDELIKYWVCQPPPPDTAFPDVWKSNLVIRPVLVPVMSTVGTHHHQTYFPGNHGASRNFIGPTWALCDLDGTEIDEDKFMEAFSDWCDACNMDWQEAILWIIKINYTDIPVTWWQHSTYTPPPIPGRGGVTMKSKAAQNIEVPGSSSPAVAGHLHHDSAFNDMMGVDDEQEAAWEKMIIEGHLKNSKGSTEK